MDSEKKAVILHEDRQIDEAIRFLHGQKELMESELTLRAKEIGDYLIHHFFQDDLEQISSQNPLKNMSFRRLCERSDLPFSESALRRFLHVAVNFRFLPLDKAKELPPSHHSVLYQVADTEERSRIGCQAVDQSFSVRRLRQVVKGKGRRRPGGGRKPLTEFQKNWKLLVQAAENLAQKVEKESFIEEDSLGEIWQESRTIRDHINKIMDRLMEIPQVNLKKPES